MSIPRNQLINELRDWQGMDKEAQGLVNLCSCAQCADFAKRALRRAIAHGIRLERDGEGDAADAQADAADTGVTRG